MSDNPQFPGMPPELQAMLGKLLADRLGAMELDRCAKERSEAEAKAMAHDVAELALEKSRNNKEISTLLVTGAMYGDESHNELKGIATRLDFNGNKYFADALLDTVIPAIAKSHPEATRRQRIACAWKVLWGIA